MDALEWSRQAPVFSQRQSEGREDDRTCVELEVTIAAESNFFVGFSENLSRGGVFVATYMTLPIGHKISLALSLPGGRRLELEGEVRWTRLPSANAELWPGLGVQFEELTEEQEAAIREFLRLREPLFFDA